MILDKQEHRELLMELIDNSVFKGNSAELVTELKKAIIEAEVQIKDNKE